MSAEQAIRLQRDGFVVLSQIYHHDELEVLIEQADRAIEYARSTHQLGPVNLSDQLQPCWFEDAAQRRGFVQTLFSASLHEQVDSLLQEIYVHNLQLFYNPKDGREPYWHRDLQFSSLEDAEHRALLPELQSHHLRIPLLSERGLYVVPGSHRRWDDQTERRARKSAFGLITLPNQQLIELSAGDVLIFHSELIHRGEYQANTERLAYDVCVGQPHIELLKHYNAENRVEPSLASLSKWLEAAPNKLEP